MCEKKPSFTSQDTERKILRFRWNRRCLTLQKSPDRKSLPACQKLHPAATKPEKLVIFNGFATNLVMKILIYLNHCPISILSLWLHYKSWLFWVFLFTLELLNVSFFRSQEWNVSWCSSQTLPGSQNDPLWFRRLSGSCKKALWHRGSIHPWHSGKIQKITISDAKNFFNSKFVIKILTESYTRVKLIDFLLSNIYRFRLSAATKCWSIWQNF